MKFLTKSLSAPYLWIPSLYFTQGFPFAVVTLLAAILYKELGVANDSIALFVSIFGLPWALKPLWSPLMEIVATKKKWVIGGQFLSSAVLLALATGLFCQNFYYLSLPLFLVLAFSSATYDIASDGYYLLNIDYQLQARHVGLRTMFYQLGRFFCSGGIVMMIGKLQHIYSKAVAWQFGFLVIGILMLILAIYHLVILPEKELPYCATKTTLAAITHVFLQVFKNFFSLKNGIVLLVFLLIYNAPETQLSLIMPLFLLDKVDQGGLALSVSNVGFIVGFLGTSFLILGALTFGWIMRNCTRVPIIQLTFISALLNCGYILLANFRLTSLWLVASVVIIAQFGFGLTSSAYMAFLMNLFGKHNYRTSFYAIGTACMGVGVTFFGMFSGYLQRWLAFRGFFWWIAGLSLIILLFTIFATKKLPEHVYEPTKT